MTTTIRIEEPGGTYHICANAVFGHSLFREEVDYLRYLDLLEEEITRSGWTLLEYSLMTTHVHLLVTIDACTLGTGFQRLQSRYARAFNRRHKRRGVVWLRRYHDEYIASERHLFETIRYIARNAVRAGICEKSEEYQWCSYGAAVGGYGADPIVDEAALLELFHQDAAVARRMLRSYVEEPDPRMRRRQTRIRRASDAEK